MWAGMLVFWGLLIWAVYALITGLTRRPGQPHGSGDARTTLDGRLARGEISPEEYQRLCDLIDAGAHRTVGHRKLAVCLRHAAVDDIGASMRQAERWLLSLSLRLPPPSERHEPAAVLRAGRHWHIAG